MRHTLRIFIFAVAVFSFDLFAEPWMASRFAQNCASCHAPGRVNLPELKTRRCSFSCKSCHTNPNGGGLRNFYGKWNEERWLRSMYFSDYKLNKPRPAPAAQQPYQEAKLKNYLASVKDPKDIERIENEGPRMAETTDDVPEKEYDRHNNPAPIVDDAKEAKLRIPQGDPYRMTQQNYFNGGADFRWFYLDSKTNGVDKKGMVPMAIDVGASVKPFEHFTAVWEARFFSDPRTTDVWDDSYTSGAGVRSAYAMYDDMPYNSYAMYGIYMPMFGNQSPDHTTLMALATGLDQHVTFKSAGLGRVGNLPFFNVNVIEPFSNRAMPQDRGIVFNVGARFETLGSYIMFSWWDTKAKDYTDDVITSHRYQAVSGGLTKGRVTFVGQITDMLIDKPQVRRDSGTVISAEPRYRFWRETYLKGSYEYLNTAPSLKLGHAKQWGAGIGSFLASGLEFEVMYKDLEAEDTGVTTKGTNMWAQAHLFF